LSVAIIINPVSGGARPDVARTRAVLAAAVIETHGDRAEVFVTERGPCPRAGKGRRESRRPAGDRLGWRRHGQ
jgi:hypothetical protein